MAAVSPESGEYEFANNNLKVDESEEDDSGNIKLGKWSVCAWAAVTTALIILLVAFIILFAIWAIRLEHTQSATVTVSSRQCDLKVCNRSFKKPPLILISLDGFRNSYLQQNITPAIQRLINCGTHSKYLRPTFPSKTFPNHYTIVTGLYPPWSGVIDNHFYDPKLKKFFITNTNESGWYLGEPIWNTVEKNGGKSAIYFWPGSEAVIEGMRPTYWNPYNSAVPFTERIDQMIEWLNLAEDKRPDLIQIYFNQPDTAGHMGGPFSNLVRTAMITVDAVINYLTEVLLKEGLMGCVNLVVLSDHGMQKIDDSRKVVVNKFYPQKYDDLFFYGVVARMQANDTIHPPGTDIYSTISNVSKALSCQKGMDFLLYEKDLLPVRLHYSGNPRIGDVVIKGRPSSEIYLNEEQKRRHIVKGDHGYDNRLVSMRAIFLAIGPDIVERNEIDAFQNIELYNLFADLLRLKPAPTNGTYGVLHSVLKNRPEWNDTEVAVHGACTPFITMKLCESASNTCPAVNPKLGCQKPFESIVDPTLETENWCKLTLCDAKIYFDQTLSKTVIIDGFIDKETWKSTIDECIWYIDGMNHTKSCETSAKNLNETIISLFVNKQTYNTLDISRFTVPSSFANGTWQYLVNQISEHLNQFSPIRFIAGAAYDLDGDGLRDADHIIRTSRSPTHIFYVLLKCASGHALQRNDFCDDFEFLPYILPVNSNNKNCLTPADYLSDNTARLRDIELLTGIEFFRNRKTWNWRQALQLRTLLVESNW